MRDTALVKYAWLVDCDFSCHI